MILHFIDEHLVRLLIRMISYCWDKAIPTYFMFVDKFIFTLNKCLALKGLHKKYKLSYICATERIYVFMRGLRVPSFIPICYVEG